MTEVKFVLNTGFAGAKHREVIEFEDLPVDGGFFAISS